MLAYRWWHWPKYCLACQLTRASVHNLRWRQYHHRHHNCQGYKGVNKCCFYLMRMLISAGYDHVPWLDRSNSRFHERSRVHRNSKEEWSPIAIQHFHFTGWRQCTKASQASYSVSVERILRWRSFHSFPVLAFIVFGYAVLYGVRMELQKLAKEYEESQLINKTLIN